MKRDVLKTRFRAEEIPRFPCPHCEGRLRLAGEVKIHRSAATAWIANQAWSDIAQIEDEFHTALICESAECGQVVGMMGAVRYLADHEAGGSLAVELLEPKTFFPAPALIAIPNNTPPSVIREIRNAFSIAWIDPNAAAHRLQVSAEYIMDDFGIPEIVSGQRMTVDRRISLFGETNMAARTHADTFSALRTLGDSRAHGGEVDWPTLLDAFEIFESALEDLYGDKANMVAAAHKRLSDFARHARSNDGPQSGPPPAKPVMLREPQDEQDRGAPIRGREWPLGGLRNPVTGEPFASEAEAQAALAGEAASVPRESRWPAGVRKFGRT
ncbi:MAG: hypothetical protein JO111_06080 [Caulobacteraceae bacterium]|nr:hypothetical protein [Caulobacteraceae bacterium]